MSLVLLKLSKNFSGIHGQSVGAVRDLNLTIADREFLVIVGPSGCGKTTTLRLIAGLETDDGGQISLDGKSLDGVEPKDRDVAMVFQHHALLPHLTAFDNMGFGLTLRRVPKDEIRRRVRQAAATLRLEHLLERKPGALSGGECQRVALGRALVRQPRVFLLDEPLSDLDAPMRLQLRAEIAAVHRQSGAIMVYVTHDQSEAMALADRIAVMRDGILQQCGDPMELYHCPTNRFVAGFIGSPPMNFFDGQLAGNGGGLEFHADDGWKIRFPAPTKGQPSGSVILGLRPEHIVLDPTGDIEARLERVERGGAENLFYLSAGGNPFILRSPDGLSLKPGDSVRARFEMRHARFFDSRTEVAFQ